MIIMYNDMLTLNDDKNKIQINFQDKYKFTSKEFMARIATVNLSIVVIWMVNFDLMNTLKELIQSHQINHQMKLYDPHLIMESIFAQT